MSKDGSVVVEARRVVNTRSYHEVVITKCSCKGSAVSPWVGLSEADPSAARRD